MPFGFNPWIQHQQNRTSVKQDPCPHCAHSEYVVKNEQWVCLCCGLTRAEATAHGPKKLPAQRDGNGSLCCQKCGDPNPYAEPDVHGNFVCTSCKTGV
jgi:hypothetical protein